VRFTPAQRSRALVSSSCSLATYDGEVVFHSARGELLPHKLVIPKLAVHKARTHTRTNADMLVVCACALPLSHLSRARRSAVRVQDWHVGLSADPLDHAHPDIGDAPRDDSASPDAGAANGGGRRRRRLMQVDGDPGGGHGFDSAARDAADVVASAASPAAAAAAAADAAAAAASDVATSDVAGEEAFERFRADDETWDEGLGDVHGFPYADGGYGDDGNDGAAFDPLAGLEGASDGIRPPREYAHEGAYDAVASAVMNARKRAAATAAAIADAGGDSGAPAPPTPPAPVYPSEDAYEGDYGGGWGDQEWEPEDSDAFWKDPEEGMIRIDAHVLCSPTVADLDGDGVPELIVAVSYFFDKEARACGVWRWACCACVAVCVLSCDALPRAFVC
jgi:hypothetical protein